MTKLLLLGDSLIADNDWQPRLPNYAVYNHGVPGIMASDLWSMLPEIREAIPSCDLVMVMIGTNDLLTGNHDFIHTIKKILIQIIHDYPTAEVLVNGLFPMELPYLPPNSITSINCHIEAISMQTGCCYLNTHNRLLESDETIFADDGIHLTKAAYEIWSRTLLEHIAFLIEDE